MDDDAISEFRSLLAAAEALVAWEREIGGDGFPRVEVQTEPRFEASAPRATTPKRDPRGSDARPPSGERAAEPDLTVVQVAASAAPAETDGGGDERRSLTVLAREAASCTRCSLHENRTRSVFARGNPDAEIVFVGEGPGYNEDQQGEPFVGAAGQLLDKMIAAMGYARDEVYICNVVKCRPPDNRTPSREEAAACEPYLAAQLDAVSPKVIVTLGKCATENLGCMPEHERRWRGVFREYRGIPVMPTYHPAFLLRSPQFKRPVWEDLQAVMTRLGRRPPR